MVKQDGSRLLKDVLQELLEASTLHGLPKIASSRQLIVKVLWLLLFLSTVVALGLQIYDIHQQYTSYPIQTSVALEFSPLNFPLISLCNMNPVRMSKLRTAPRLMHYIQFKKTLPAETEKDEPLNTTLPIYEDQDADDNGDFDEIFRLFWNKYGSGDGTSFDNNAPSESRPQKPRDHWEDLTQGLKDVLVGERSETRQKLGHQIKQFIHTVTYLGEIVNKSQYDQFLNYDYGNCFTVPTDKLQAFRSGFDHGIKISLNLKINQYIPNFADGYGVRIVFHQPGTYPMPAEEGLTINPGFETNIGLRAVNITRLGMPYGECQTGDTFRDTYGFRYTTSSCLEFCRIQLIIKICACLPHDHPDIEAFRHRNLTLCDPGAKAGCVEAVTRFFQDELNHCNCQEPCREVVYARSLSFRQWPNKAYLEHVLMKGLCKSPSTQWRRACSQLEKGNLDNERFRRNFIRIVVYFESLKYETIKEMPLYEYTRFLSDVGGLLGLFTGASLLSAVELLQLILALCGYFWSRAKPPPVTKAADDDK